MARARNIKPGFFKNEELAALGAEAMLLFAGLWTLADRAGRLEDRPKRIKAELFPYWPDIQIDTLLSSLNGAGFVVRYEVAGIQYMHIPNFGKHQHPHVNEVASTIPAPEHSGASTGVAPEKHHTAPVPIRLVSDSLIPITDSLNAGPSLVEATAERMYALHPKKKNKPLVERQLVAISQKGGDLGEIEACHKLWCATDKWNENDGYYAPRLDEWLADEGYTKRPRSRDPTSPYAGMKYLGTNEEVL